MLIKGHTRTPILDFPAGCGISLAAEGLVLAAHLSPTYKARGSFNGVMLVARRVSTPDAIVSQYHKKFDARSKKKRRSAKSKAEERNWVAKIREVREKHDELMQQLPSLDFADHLILLNWLCEYQNPSDFTFVTNREPHVVVETFAQHGYHPIEKADVIDTEDKVAMAKVLIGQALDMLVTYGLVHQVIHYHVEAWKEKFITVH